jgi:glycerol-3-phosphate dehydrogenase
MNQITKANFDVCVIGGGINGAGIARDVAGRGLSTLLLEKGDLGNATSSSSSKMIHGGLRYLEHYEFGLVRKALKERNVLLAMAPHIVRPMRFFLPHEPYLRPAWLIRMGLFLYDFLAVRDDRLKASGASSLNNTVHKNLLSGSYKKIFFYSDCSVDDSRLVVLNAVDAVKKGAHVRPRHECISATRKGGRWLLVVQNNVNDTQYCVTAKMLVNAGGPWVRSILDKNDLADSKTLKVRLVKGSHLIVPKMYEGDHGYLLQQPDKRVIFVWPYEGKYSLIGTTEELHDGDPKDATISTAETDYLCAAINRSFKQSLSPDDVLWSYSGVRPLLEDGEESASAVTRDYRLELENDDAPLLSVFGGKITTYRRLAENAVEKIVDTLNFNDKKGKWTHKEPLPGGNILEKDFPAFVSAQKKRYPWVPDTMLERYALSYGTRMKNILQYGESLVGLGVCYGDDVYEKEILYMIKTEMAMTMEDILWRRSKLGLHLSDDVIAHIAADLPRLLKEAGV